MNSNGLSLSPPLQIALIVLIAAILLTQGIFLFRSAQKHGRHAWFWGIWGLIKFPTPLVLYYFLVIRRDRKRMKQQEPPTDTDE